MNTAIERSNADKDIASLKAGLSEGQHPLKMGYGYRWIRAATQAGESKERDQLACGEHLFLREDGMFSPKALCQ